DDAGDGRGLGEALLLDEQVERAPAAAAGLDFVGSGLLAILDDGAHAQGLQEAAAGGAGGEGLESGGGLGLPDVCGGAGGGGGGGCWWTASGRVSAWWPWEASGWGKTAPGWKTLSQPAAVTRALSPPLCLW